MFFRLHYLLYEKLSVPGARYYGAIVLVVSIGLMVFKIGVNETTLYGCLRPRPGEFEKLINYMGFAIWTTMLLWEGSVVLQYKRN